MKRLNNPRRVHRKIHLRAVVLILLLCVGVGFLVGFTGRFAVRSVLKSLYPLQYEKEVEIGCQAQNLPRSFVYAVIKCESGFDPQAVSNVGARGLMQLMPETFRWLCSKTGEECTEDDLFDPAINVRYGCYLLHILLSEFAGEQSTAVAAYHAGIGNVGKWLRDEQYSADGKTLRAIPFGTTERYVKRVKKVQRIYAALYDLD